MLLHDQLGARRQIEALQRIGAAVALDDFGTGYSSLNYLAGLPFDKIKIDRSFVKGVCGDDRRQAIVRHIVALARELNMRVTAEGVESEEEAVLLTAAGCTSLQGFFFARALSAPEIGRRLESERRRISRPWRTGGRGVARTPRRGRRRRTPPRIARERIAFHQDLMAGAGNIDERARA